MAEKNSVIHLIKDRADLHSAQRVKMWNFKIDSSISFDLSKVSTLRNKAFAMIWSSKILRRFHSRLSGSINPQNFRGTWNNFCNKFVSVILQTGIDSKPRSPMEKWAILILSSRRSVWTDLFLSEPTAHSVRFQSWCLSPSSAGGIEMPPPDRLSRWISSINRTSFGSD